jgi:replicative DNA helicase
LSTADAAAALDLVDDEAPDLVAGTSVLVERAKRLAELAREGRRSVGRVESMEEVLVRYEAERSGGDDEPIRLGWGTLDAELHGVSGGQVLGVAARTGVGKTWILNSLVEFFAARRDSGALILSLEMPGPEWLERQLAIREDVSTEQVEQWARHGTLLAHTADFLERMRNVVLADKPARLAEFGDLCAEARDRLDVPLRLVVIDYLGLLDTDGPSAYERASALGRGLKLAAKQEGVSVVVALQLSRAAGDGWQPVTASTLRDSGVLEESLDFLIGAWQPARDPNVDPIAAQELRDTLRCSILKNRKGAAGRVVDLQFRPQSRRVYEPAGETLA